MLTPLAPKCFAALPNAPSFLTKQAAGGQESSGANGFGSSATWGSFGNENQPSKQGANFISVFFFEKLVLFPSPLHHFSQTLDVWSILSFENPLQLHVPSCRGF